MESNKIWYRSKRIQGWLIATIALLSYSFNFDYDESAVTEAVQGGLAFCGLLWNLYGSIVAKDKLTLAQ